MATFKITMKDNSHEGIYQLEAAIRNVGEWKDFWGKPDGDMSKAWAESRWSLGVKRIDPGGILRWNAKPQSTSAGTHEVLWPSMCVPNATGYVWSVQGNHVECGTSIPYAQNHDQGNGAYTRKTSRKKSGVVTVPTPKRPLVRFGDKFIDDVREHMKRLPMNMAGAKVGITGAELSARFLMSVGGRP